MTVSRLDDDFERQRSVRVGTLDSLELNFASKDAGEEVRESVDSVRLLEVDSGGPHHELIGATDKFLIKRYTRIIEAFEEEGEGRMKHGHWRSASVLFFVEVVTSVIERMCAILPAGVDSKSSSMTRSSNVLRVLRYALIHG